MNLQDIVASGRAVGVARLLVLTLAAAGFLAMHGLAATDPMAGHHSPMHLAAAVDHPGPASVEMPHETAPEVVAAPTHTGGGDAHDGMAACVFVLLGVVAAFALHALRGGFGATSGVSLTTVREGRRPPRAPPRPVFLSLCVFRL